MKHYDLIVIGSGPAGEKAALFAAYHGYRAALVEKSSQLGGAGTNTGTMPSKTLKETALYLSGMMEKGVFGVNRTLEHEAGIKDFFYRKNVVTDLQSSDTRKNLIEHQVDVYHGEASFNDANTVSVAGEAVELISADYIVIATGSYPFHIPGIPFDGQHVHDSDTILTLDHIPASMVIVGAGVIGCEYATIFAAMGCQVSLVNGREDFLTFIDKEIIEALRERMEADGVTFIMNNRVEGVEIDTSGEQPVVHAHLTNGQPIAAEMFLYAAGRSGNTAKLNLAAAGLEANTRGLIEVDGTYQTKVPHIYAVGDVIGFPALGSTSMDQGRVAVTHIFNLHEFERIDQEIPYGIYTIPEVSSVGLSEEGARDKGLNYGVGRAYYRDMPRGRILGLNHGLLKVIFEQGTERILGIHIIGKNATDLIHTGLLMVEENMTLRRAAGLIYNFPTLNELYKYACMDGLRNSTPSVKA